MNSIYGNAVFFWNFIDNSGMQPIIEEDLIVY